MKLINVLEAAKDTDAYIFRLSNTQKYDDEPSEGIDLVEQRVQVTDVKSLVQKARAMDAPKQMSIYPIDKKTLSSLHGRVEFSNDEIEDDDWAAAEKAMMQAVKATGAKVLLAGHEVEDSYGDDTTQTLTVFVILAADEKLLRAADEYL